MEHSCSSSLSHRFSYKEILCSLAVYEVRKPWRHIGIFKIRYIELCNPFSRISNSFPRISNSFPRISNSFPRIGQLVLLDCNSFPRIKQSVLSNCNSFPRIAIRSLELHISNSRERIAIRELSNSRERIAQFDITIYLWLFWKSPCPFRTFVIPRILYSESYIFAQKVKTNI